MKSTEKLREQYTRKVREHVAYFKRVLLTDLEHALAADQLTVTLVNRRFIAAVQSDVQQYLRRAEGRDPKDRLSMTAARMVSAAVAEPMRADVYRSLQASVRRRAREAKWAKDSLEYNQAVAELVEKELRDMIDAHCRQLEDYLIALLPLLVEWLRSEEE